MSHHSCLPLPPPPACALTTFVLYSRAYLLVTSRAYPSSSNAKTYIILFSRRALDLLRAEVPGNANEDGAGVGSKTLRLLTIQRIGSTGSQRPSGREKTSVQKTGGVESGS